MKNFALLRALIVALCLRPISITKKTTSVKDSTPRLTFVQQSVVYVASEVITFCKRGKSTSHPSPIPYQPLT